MNPALPELPKGHRRFFHVTEFDDGTWFVEWDGTHVRCHRKDGTVSDPLEHLTIQEAEMHVRAKAWTEVRDSDVAPDQAAEPSLETPEPNNFAEVIAYIEGDTLLSALLHDHVLSPDQTAGKPLEVGRMSAMARMFWLKTEAQRRALTAEQDLAIVKRLWAKDGAKQAEIKRELEQRAEAAERVVAEQAEDIANMAKKLGVERTYSESQTTKLEAAERRAAGLTTLLEKLDPLLAAAWGLSNVIDNGMAVQVLKRNAIAALREALINPNEIKEALAAKEARHE